MDVAFDAIIVGAGPAGSSAAILLARSGWRVALIEKHHFPRRKVCGECIAASNLPLLEALGVGREFFRLAGPPLQHVALMVGAHILRAGLPPYEEGSHRWGVALGREHLDTLLLEEAVRCGARVFQPWEARDIAGEPGSFVCCVRDTQSKDQRMLTAPVLIAAHGSWEALQATRRRQQAPIQLPPSIHCPSDLFAFKANYLDASLDRSLLPVLSFPGGYGGMVIGDHDTATLAFCMRRDTLEACRKRFSGRKAGEAAAAYVADHCKGVRNALTGAHQCGTWLSVGPIRPGIRISPHTDHAFLIGNAAGEAHPIIGEGISMAIQSAWLLAEKLAPHRARIADRALQARVRQAYGAAWRHHFSARIRLAAVFSHAAMRPSLCSGIVPVLKRYPMLLSRFAQWSGKIRAAPEHASTARRLLNINDGHG